MKKTSDTILKKEIIISFSELLLKEVALNYLDLLKKYEKGDAHHLILEFLNVSVLLLDQVIEHKKSWITIGKNLLSSLKIGISLENSAQNEVWKVALTSCKKEYRYLFIKLNFIFSLINDKFIQKELFDELYTSYVDNLEKDQNFSKLFFEAYSQKLSRKRKYDTFNINQLQFI